MRRCLCWCRGDAAFSRLPLAWKPAAAASAGPPPVTAGQPAGLARAPCRGVAVVGVSVNVSVWGWLNIGARRHCLACKQPHQRTLVLHQVCTHPHPATSTAPVPAAAPHDGQSTGQAHAVANRDVYGAAEGAARVPATAGRGASGGGAAARLSTAPCTAAAWRAAQRRAHLLASSIFNRQPQRSGGAATAAAACFPKGPPPAAATAAAPAAACRAALRWCCCRCRGCCPHLAL